MKRNILYIHSGDNWIAGSEKVFLSLMQRLDRSHFQPHLICDQPVMAEAAARLGVPARVMKFHTFLLSYQYRDLNPIAYLKTVFQIWKAAKNWKIDLIHATNGNPAQYSLPAARLLRVPFVCHIQTHFHRRSRVGALIGFSDRVIAVSHAIAGDYRASPKASAKVRVVYNAVDLNDFSPGTDPKVKKEFGFSPEDTVVGTVAYLIPRKGVDTFVRVAKLLEGEPRLKFVLAGKGPMEGELQNLIRELGQENRVKLLGLRLDVAQVLKGVDIFCLLSLSDPLPYSVIEASAAGLPVVASDVDGVREIVEDGIGGILVSPRNLDQIKEAILKLARDPELREKMGECGRQKISEQFSYKKHLREISEVYGELLKEGYYGRDKSSRTA